MKMVQEATNLDKTAEFIILRLEQVTEKKSQSFIHVAGCQMQALDNHPK